MSICVEVARNMLRYWW